MEHRVWRALQQSQRPVADGRLGVGQRKSRQVEYAQQKPNPKYRAPQQSLNASAIAQRNRHPLALAARCFCNRVRHPRSAAQGWALAVTSAGAAGFGRSGDLSLAFGCKVRWVRRFDIDKWLLYLVDGCALLLKHFVGDRGHVHQRIAFPYFDFSSSPMKTYLTSNW